MSISVCNRSGQDAVCNFFWSFEPTQVADTRLRVGSATPVTTTGVDSQSSVIPKTPGRWADRHLPTSKRKPHELFPPHHRRCNGFGPDRLRPPCCRGGACGGHCSRSCRCHGCYRVNGLYRFYGFYRRHRRDGCYRGVCSDSPRIAVARDHRRADWSLNDSGLADSRPYVDSTIQRSDSAKFVGRGSWQPEKFEVGGDLLEQHVRADLHPATS